jgi:hypothetical protein
VLDILLHEFRYFQEIFRNAKQSTTRCITTGATKPPKKARQGRTAGLPASAVTTNRRQ